MTIRSTAIDTSDHRTNLPRVDPTDSADRVKSIFNKYFTESLSFPSNEVDAVVGFFESREFDPTSARTLGTILMQQARLDNVKVFELLDTLKGIETLQLSSIVTEVLNYNRSKISTLGYRVDSSDNKLEKRNVLV